MEEQGAEGKCNTLLHYSGVATDYFARIYIYQHYNRCVKKHYYICEECGHQSMEQGCASHRDGG